MNAIRIHIVFPALFPYELPRPRMRSVKIVCLADPASLVAHAPIIAHKISALRHFSEVFRASVHRRPYRDHRFNPHIPQFCNHAAGIRETAAVKAEIAFQRPVEEVYNNHIHGISAFFMFPRHTEHFLLCAVAQLTLPVPHAILRHHGHMSRHIGIMPQNHLRRIPGCNPVIQFLAGLRCPFSQIHAEYALSDGWIVPEKTIPAAGEIKRHGRL